MKTAIVNLVGAILIAASILLGFGMLWDQREKQHKEEIKELTRIHINMNSGSSYIGREITGLENSVGRIWSHLINVFPEKSEFQRRREQFPELFRP